jgi:hypothetical protein
MRILFVVAPVIAALAWPGLALAEDAEEEERARSDDDQEDTGDREEDEGEDEDDDEDDSEWVYLGAHLGGQFLDLEALSAGDAINQVVDDAYNDAISSGTIDPAAPQPRQYSADNGFEWGVYGGLNLGRWFRIGVRLTHSVLDVQGEGVSSGEPQVKFELDLITALIEAQLRIPLSIFVPFVGIGVGYAFLGGDTSIISSQQADSDFGLSCFDAMGVVGLDINLGSWFSIGAAAHFSFIGFYYDGGDDTTQAEATWGFATDYLARVTFRI